jgi:hypothetical protein
VSSTQVSIVPAAWSTWNSMQNQRFGAGARLRSVPAGLITGNVASSDSRLYISTPFWPPMRRCRPPSAASVIARSVVWPAPRASANRT